MACHSLNAQVKDASADGHLAQLKTLAKKPSDSAFIACLDQCGTQAGKEFGFRFTPKQKGISQCFAAGFTAKDCGKKQTAYLICKSSYEKHKSSVGSLNAGDCFAFSNTEGLSLVCTKKDGGFSLLGLVDPTLSGRGAFSFFSSSDWQILRLNSENEAVNCLQYLLLAKGETLTATGTFDEATKTAVENIQRANSLSVDGIVGENTWKKLISTVRHRETGQTVRALQHMLRFHGYGIDADGDFGGGTLTNVKDFQFISDLTDDGIAGDDTWKALMTWSKSFPSSIIAAGNDLRCDPAGKGHYLASRGGRSHNGVDILAEPTVNVLAPFGGSMIRVAPPNANGVLSGIYIQGTPGSDWKDYKVKMFYMSPSISPSDTFAAGDTIGQMQRILDGPSYNNRQMLNHVHIELEYKDRRVNPAPFLELGDDKICD